MRSRGTSSVGVDLAGYRIRPATAEDAPLLWQWANDPEVRRQAFHSEAIPWTSHLAWYAGKLADSRCLVAILETDHGATAGQIRFEEVPEGLAVDLSVAPTRRGQGIGRVVLLQGLELAAQRWAKGTAVLANVLAGNARSRRVFEACGFVRKGTGMRQGKLFDRLERLL